jgi:hypothetical protein
MESVALVYTAGRDFQTAVTGRHGLDRGIGLNGKLAGLSFHGSKMDAPLPRTSLAFRVAR